MRKFTLLTCSIVCLVVLISCVECFAEPTVKMEYALPTIEGAFMRPRISGDWVVALQQDEQRKNTLGVLVINLTNNQIYTAYVGKAMWPSISGTLAIWPGAPDNVDSLKGMKGKDGKLTSLIMLDLSTWRYFAPPLSTRTTNYTTVCGTSIALECGSRIYLMDAVSGIHKRISKDESRYSAPEINGDYVVWRDTVSDSESQVIGYQISTGRLFNVTEDADVINCGGITDGKHIAWWSNKNGVGVYDCVTRNTINIPKGFFPDVENGIVVYLKKANGQNHVFGTEIATGKEFQISKGNADQGPSIDKGRVIWCNGGVIYCAVLDLKANEKVPIKKDTPLTN